MSELIYSGQEAYQPAKRDAIDYINAAKTLETIKDTVLRNLLYQMMVDELLLDRRLRSLRGTNEAPNWTIVTSRAIALGYSGKEVGSGVALNKYVHALIEPVSQKHIGSSKVYHYEVTEELDAVIHDFFSLKKRMIV